MSYCLYYSPGAASMAVHWMLIELKVPFEKRLIDLKQSAQHTIEYRELNPLGRVPTLVIDGIPRTESAALLMMLAERHSAKGLAPSIESPERCEWLELMIYLANTLLPAMRDWFYAGIDGELANAEAVKALAQSRIEQAWQKLDHHLADGRSYFVGNTLSTVDFLAMMLMRWSRNMTRPATTWEHLNDYVSRLKRIPSFVELNAHEGLADWNAC